MSTFSYLVRVANPRGNDVHLPTAPGFEGSRLDPWVVLGELV